MAKANTYTEEETQALVSAYEAARAEGKSNAEIIETLALETGRPKRSLVSKLSRRGIYVPGEKGKTSTKEDGQSKKEQFAVLEQLGYDAEGLEGATKTALSNLIDYVQATNSGNSEDQAVAA